MTNSKQKPLVPITREFLRQFYQKYPLEPVPQEARNVFLNRIEELVKAVTKPGSKVPEQIGMPSPTRIDDCFWRNRMICEELALSMLTLHKDLVAEPELAEACERCRSHLVSAERSIFAVQEHNTASVKAQLQQFIPQDFRGALLERQRVATESRYKKQVEDLVKQGGTIRQKYDLYLQQQWERRQALVQLGECSGMYKMVIKWVAGIPQVLLDFAKEINAKLGPMEEQRIKYGPDLYGITELGLRLNVCLAAWVESADAAAPAARSARPRLLDVIEPAVSFYCEHMLRVVRHIGDVFQHSPFFVNKDDLEGSPEGGRERKVNSTLDAPPPAAMAVAVVAKQQVDAECISSNVSAASASADDGVTDMAGTPPMPPIAVGSGEALPLALSITSSVPLAPVTPGLIPKAQPRTATMLSGREELLGCYSPGVIGDVKPCTGIAAASSANAASSHVDREEGKTGVDLQPKVTSGSTRSEADGARPVAVVVGGSVGLSTVTAVSNSNPVSVSTLPLTPAMTGKEAGPHHLVASPPHALHASLMAQQHQQLPGSNQGHGLSLVCSHLRRHPSSGSHGSFVSALEYQSWNTLDEYVSELQQQQQQQHHTHNQQKQERQSKQQQQQQQQQDQQQNQLLHDNNPKVRTVDPPGARAREPVRGCFSGCFRLRSNSNGGGHEMYVCGRHPVEQQRRGSRDSAVAPGVVSAVGSRSPDGGSEYLLAIAE